MSALSRREAAEAENRVERFGSSFSGASVQPHGLLTLPGTFPLGFSDSGRNPECGSSFVLEGHVLKRSVDIFLSGLLLALSLPFLAFAAILIKLDSPGPVIFRQVRTGKGFKRFQLLKLRTMQADAGGSPYTLGADPRITRVGRWLRKFKLDELPQLWNVLRGEMSLVGPRPVVPELTEEFYQAYTRLLEARPGLSDPATLKYCRETEILALVPEPLRYFKTVVTPDKLRISQAYLERANLWSDLGVVAKSTFVLLAPRRQMRFRSALRRMGFSDEEE
jgi:lipopolysaccharide/colanic/teichoic acid biosynthesis glycosyltransferase